MNKALIALSALAFSSQAYGAIATVYDTSVGTGWCGAPVHLKSVALSSVYINGVSPNSGNCGKCICVRLESQNSASNYMKPIGPFVVDDLCPSCTGDHIDLSHQGMGNQIDGGMDEAFRIGRWDVSWRFADCSANCGAVFGGAPAPSSAPPSTLEAPAAAPPSQPPQNTANGPATPVGAPASASGTTASTGEPVSVTCPAKSQYASKMKRAHPYKK